jgi:hypothetical protein
MIFYIIITGKDPILCKAGGTFMKNRIALPGKLPVGAIFAILFMAVLARADFVTGTITAGTHPFAVAVNPVTNRTYVATYGSRTVTVINAAPHDSATLRGENRAAFVFQDPVKSFLTPLKYNY